MPDPEKEGQDFPYKFHDCSTATNAVTLMDLHNADERFHKERLIICCHICAGQGLFGDRWKFISDRVTWHPTKEWIEIMKASKLTDAED